jgi:hypothetical protein
MPLGAWVMLLFGCVVLYGGLAACLVIAVRATKAKRAAGIGEEEEGGEEGPSRPSGNG